MRAELKKEWLEALRSGKYKQGESRLRTKEGGYCCLGVLCDVAGLKWEYSEDWDGWVAREGDARNPYLLGGFDLESELPPEPRQLWSMNDSGVSFDEIADWIEENVPVTDDAES